MAPRLSRIGLQWRRKIWWGTSALTASALIITVVWSNAHFSWASRSFGGEKNIWDWMDLLIVPVVLGAVVLLFNWQMRESDRKNNEVRARREEEAAETRAGVDREIAERHNQEESLRAYLDGMSDLLVRGLRASDKDSDDRAVARARTLAIIRSVNVVHSRNTLITFIRESKLIQRDGLSMLREADLTGADLTGADLTGAKLQRADLAHSFLDHAHLNDADLQVANLDGVFMDNADLTGANLFNAKLSHARLDGAHVQLSGSTLSGQFLSHTDLRGFNLSRARLFDDDLTESNLTNVDLSEAYLKSAELGRANLSGADLTGANMSGADLTGANLNSATLKAAVLVGTNMRDAKVTEEQLETTRTIVGSVSPSGERVTDGAEEDVSNLELGRTDLHCVDLSYANLHNTDLFETDLSGADLKFADLRDANLNGANLSNATLSNANLSGANLRFADLSNATLSNANLSGANLRYADLSNVKDLSIVQLCVAQTLSGVTGLTPELREQVKEKWPHLHEDLHEDTIPEEDDSYLEAEQEL